MFPHQCCVIKITQLATRFRFFFTGQDCVMKLNIINSEIMFIKVPSQLTHEI